MMNEQFEKEFKKHKKIVILTGLGIIFTALFTVIYFLENDKTYIAFIILLIIDIFEFIKEIKIYKKMKSEAGN